MRKRRFAVSLVVLFMFVFTALAGCSNNDNKATSTPQSTPTIQQPATTPTTPPPAEPAVQSNTPATTNPDPAPASVQQPSEPAKAVTASPPAQTNKQEVTVYVTRTGEKYHRDGCRYLAKSRIPMSLSAAKRSYGPCSVCDPPQ
ncbi:MAG TPA: hypothetical protein DER33_09995 [Syntrophomonas sp.]|jgi:competence protein ComEC|nr:hypothetical protein [Syntrophomonas sp.]